MENTGGEPDVVEQDKKKPASMFFMIVLKKAQVVEEVFVMTKKL
jgi:hypothetical protein